MVIDYRLCLVKESSLDNLVSYSETILKMFNNVKSDFKSNSTKGKYQIRRFDAKKGLPKKFTQKMYCFVYLY